MIRSDSVFWDIGANIGLFSLYAAAMNQNATILAFEPAAHNYASLCENVFINRCENIHPYAIALGVQKLRFVDLYLSEMQAGSSIHNIEERSPWATSDVVFKQPCLASSIDELVLEHGFPQPTIIKMDVDGVEVGILKTAAVALKKVTALLVELDAFDEAEVESAQEILRAAGFSLQESSTRDKKINKKLPRNFIWKK